MRRAISAVLGLLCVLSAIPALAAETGQQKPAVEPAALQQLQAMTDLLKVQPAFGFKADVTVEVVFPSGLTIQYGRNAEVTMKRPDKVIARVKGDDRNRVFAYDGKTLTIADLTANTYAVTDAPPSIDQMLDFLNQNYGVEAPMGDILYADPYKALTGNLLSATVAGVHQMAGKPCNHLAFSQRDADWQAWIDEGKKPLLRKIVINDKTVLGWPQFAAVFTDWNLSPRTSDAVFSYTPPKDMKKIEFSEMVSGRTDQR